MLLGELIVHRFSARCGAAHSRLRYGLALLALAIIWERPALGKPAGSPSSIAEQAKQEVLTALSVGNPGHAEEILDRAFRADPDPSLLYQLGLVAQAQSRPVAALDLYRRYQEIVGPAISPAINAAIETFAASVTAPVTVVNITASTDGLLCVDDKIVGMLPLKTPLLIVGGTHRFRIEQRKAEYESGPLSIPDGREADLRLTAGAKGKAVALLSLAPITMFVMPPKSLPAASTQAVFKAMADAVRQNHLAPLPQSRLTMLLSKRPAGCLDEPDCQFAVAEQAQARSVLKLLLRGDVAQDAAPNAPLTACSVQVDYVDVNAGQVAARGATQVTTCSGPPLTTALAAVLQTLLLEANGRTRGMVSVSSVPEGAEVRVDGLLRGVTPYLRASFSGPHEIIVEKKNFHSFNAKAEVVSGQVASVEAHLTALPKEAIEPPPAALRVPMQVWVERRLPRPRWRLLLGGLALGGGVLLGGFGISALTVNAQCALDPGVGEVCGANYATSTVGGGLLVTGIGLSAAGVVLLTLPGRRERVSNEILVDPALLKESTETKE